MTTAVVSQADGVRREDVVRLGLWMFLATVTMLFAAFTSAYLVRRGGSDWSYIPLPTVLWANTLVLAASSLALEAASRAGHRRNWVLANAGFLVAIVLGFAFVGGQWLAWRQLQRAGIYLPANPSSSFFYMMTGAHAIHVIAALGVLLWGASITWRGHRRDDLRSWSASIGLCRTFWHFLFGVWVYLFAFVSLF
jgi:cytochrome c oxidase subunit 3